MELKASQESCLHYSLHCCSMLVATESSKVLAALVTSFQVTVVNNLLLCYCRLPEFTFFFFFQKPAGLLEPSALREPELTVDLSDFPEAELPSATS